MHAIQHAVAAPIPEIVVNRGVRWKILRQLPPLTTAAIDIPDGVEDLAHISPAAAPSSARRRDHRRDHRPLLVAHVTRIAAPARRVRLAMGVGPHGSSPDSAAIDRITPDSYDSRTFETGSKERSFTFSRRPSQSGFKANELDDLGVRLFWLIHQSRPGDWFR